MTVSVITEEFVSQYLICAAFWLTFFYNCSILILTTRIISLIREVRRMELAFSKGLYEKSALLKAAYSFTEVAYLHLSQDDKNWYVSWHNKPGETLPSEAFENALIDRSCGRSCSMRAAIYARCCSHGQWPPLWLKPPRLRMRRLAILPFLPIRRFRMTF